MDETQAARLFGFVGELVPGVRFASVSVTAVARVDRAEVQRRQAVGLGAITDHELTQVLAQLPLDWPIPCVELDPVTLRTLAGAPEGIVELTARSVTRRWRPALTVTGVLLTSRDWQAALRNVSLFAPDAPRGVILTSPPRNLEPVVSRARELDIGVIAADLSGTWRTLAEPRHDPAYAPGPRHWRFLETTYLAWCRLVVQRSAVQLLK
jgi:hypothetical protein